jgi:tetratricopeptide (TPR) repeat protein
VIVAATAIGALAVGAALTARDRATRARRALDDGARQLASRHFTEARHTFQHGLALTQRLPFERALEQRLRDELGRAMRLDLADQLHRLADELRVLSVAEAVPRERLQPLRERCDELWQRRHAIANSLSAADDPQLAADLQEVAVSAANLHARLDDGSTGLRVLDEAQAMFGPSVALVLQRRGIGQLDASDLPSGRTAWEFIALGRARLSAGDLPGAARELSAALRLDPGGRWSNFYYGVCAQRMGRHEEAVAAFSVCIGTAPQVAGCFYNRALTYAALGRADHAANDVARALELEPSHAQARELRDLLQRRRSVPVTSAAR